VRAKPRSRPASAQRVRRLLESRLRAFPAEGKLELASWLWEEGVFRPREGDTVVLSATPPPRRRFRHKRALAVAASVLCALAIGSFVVAKGWAPGDLGARVRALAAPPSDSARVHFATDQRLRVTIDDGPAVAVEPGDSRELAPGKHRLVFEWPSGAKDDVEVDLAPGERHSVRPQLH
jgi:hypothetical protein